MAPRLTAADSDHECDLPPLPCSQVTAKTESENAKPIIDYFGLDKSKSEPQVSMPYEIGSSWL